MLYGSTACLERTYHGETSVHIPGISECVRIPSLQPASVATNAKHLRVFHMCTFAGCRFEFTRGILPKGEDCNAYQTERNHEDIR